MTAEEREAAAIELVQQAMASAVVRIIEDLPGFAAQLATAPARAVSDMFAEPARSFVGIRRDLVDPLTGTDPATSHELMRSAVLGGVS